ncbi:MAG: amidohydrolase [Bacteroidota bacterium]|nr:amidohydrolase [Bacteroidota bacterium]
MVQDLFVSLIQSNLHWENSEANLAMLEEKIWQINTKTDLIILPEMFNTGFSMEAPLLAEPMNSKTFRWMKQQAAQTGAVIIGSYIIKDNFQYYNRLFWVEPDGKFSFYDKRHLFSLAGENKVYSAGKSNLIMKWKGWKVCPLVCYDLRFPVWSRNRINSENEPLYDLLIYIANWPTPRIAAWDTLLQARAIENLSHVVGVNRIGTDEKGHQYNGHSKVIDPKGKILIDLGEIEGIETLTLRHEEQREFREKFFTFFMDADDFEVKL